MLRLLGQVPEPANRHIDTLLFDQLGDRLGVLGSGLEQASVPAAPRWCVSSQRMPPGLSLDANGMVPNATPGVDGQGRTFVTHEFPHDADRRKDCYS
jgi:hypothetical protein